MTTNKKQVFLEEHSPDLGPVPPSAAQLKHWNEVLQALRGRLLQKDPLTDAPRDAESPLARVKPWQDFSVRECLAALDEMHLALQRETAQRQAMEHACHTAETALAQTQKDLDLVRCGERSARHMALHDELTALPNRRHLLEQLRHALTESAPHGAGIAVLYIDLDAFKAVNDTHGHAVGDEVLCITAARLRAAVRHVDTVVRLGGDEFVCLLLGVANTMHLRQLCRKLLDAISAPMQIGKLQLLVHASIGIASCPQHGCITADELLERADAAMFAAKRDGCGFAFHGDHP